MDLTQLQQEVKQQLIANGWHVKREQQASIPVHTVEVQYHPVQRAVMDILMKMMLISYERAEVREPDILADILLVEPLFISDLTNKMLNLNMLKKDEDGTITLTDKGRLQKENGVFEEQLSLQTEEILFSPTHARIVEGDIEAFSELDAWPEPFHYAIEEFTTLDESALLTYLTDLQPVAQEDEPQSFVTDVVTYESVQVNDVPIFVFICYEDKGARYFAKVYNVLTNEWDETLEALVTTNEKSTWATQFD